MSACRIMQIDPYLSTCIHFKFKWIIDLNIKSNASNMVEEKVRNRHEHIGTLGNFLNRTQIAPSVRSAINIGTA